MSRAVRAGADAVELDVHATSDGHVVCCHDPTLERTTDGSGPIAQATLAEIQSLDAAHWFVEGLGAEAGLEPSEYRLRGLAAADPRYRVPTLGEVLAELQGVVVNIDIKQTSPAVEGYEEAVAACIEEAGREEDVIVASFHPGALDRFASILPSVATSAHPGEVAEFVRAVTMGEEPPRLARAALQVPPRFGGIEVVTPALVEAAHRAGLALHVWTIDDEAEAERLVRMGVDGIMTDRPAAISAAMRRASR